jgi:integrase
MDYVKIEIHARNLEYRKKGFLNDKKIPEEEKRDIVEFLRLAGLGKINLRKKIGTHRLLKYLDNLRIPIYYFKKPLDEITLKDMENFEKDLSNNTIKNKRNNKPYSDNTKSDFKKALRIYLRWKLKDNPSKFAELTNWLDTSVKTRTPEYLKEQDIIKLYKSCKDSKQRFLIAVLFDAGCRIEEFLNIRREDIEEPNANSPYYRLTLKEEYSKTAGRTIGLYWQYSTEAIRDYLSEHSFKPSEPVYTAKYDDIRFFLVRFGKRVLNRRVYAHLFRHSSATYYASKLNRQQLCYRFGWAFCSKMPDTYISRAGMVEEKINEQFKNEEIGQLRERLDKYEQLLKIAINTFDSEKEVLTLVKENLIKKKA